MIWSINEKILASMIIVHWFRLSCSLTAWKRATNYTAPYCTLHHHNTQSFSSKTNEGLCQRPLFIVLQQISFNTDFTGEFFTRDQHQHWSTTTSASRCFCLLIGYIYCQSAFRPALLLKATRVRVQTNGLW